MSFVMIVKMHPGIVAKAAGAAELCDIENIVDTRGVVAEKFADHIAPRILLDILAIFLAKPAYPANVAVELCRELAAAGAYDVDVFAGGAGDCQHLVDAKVRMLPSVALVA